MSRWLDHDVLVRPLEATHFGAPRAFPAGDAHRAASVFPPPPSTFQGMVRSQLLRAVEPPLDLDDWSRPAREERRGLVGEGAAMPAGWQLIGPYPAVLRQAEDGPGTEGPWAEPWVPTPRFVLQGPDAGPLFARPVASTHPGLDDLGAPALLGDPPGGAEGLLGGWIGPANLRHVLCGQGRWSPDQHARDLPPFVRREQRPGLALDPATGTAAAGMLYFLAALRFAPGAGLLGRFSGRVDARIPADALGRGAGQAGRKGRPVAFEAVAHLDLDWAALLAGHHLPAEVAEDAGFWLVLLTPARVPAPRSPALHVALPAGVEVSFHTALTGPPVTLGGFDLTSGESRPNRPHLPAGSAWWFTLTGGDAEQRAAALRLIHHSHALAEPGHAPFGYGHVLVGLGPRLTASNAALHPEES